MTVRATKADAGQDIVIFSVLRPTQCADCGLELARGSLIRMEKDKALCLDCADLGHLVFLPSGDAALTRRSRKHSSLSAVVVRFSRARGRYERQGLLIEEPALEKAEVECLADSDARKAARERAAAYREKLDDAYVADFTAAVTRQFPGCPPDEAAAIARHACVKWSGRVGRSAADKQLDPTAVELAVRAHVRHAHTGYDRLLAKGHERGEARAAVVGETADVLDRWSRSTP